MAFDGVMRTPAYKTKIEPALQLVLEAHPGEKLHAAQWHERIISYGLLLPSEISERQVKRALEEWEGRGWVKSEMPKRTRYYWQEPKEDNVAA